MKSRPVISINFSAVHPLTHSGRSRRGGLHNFFGIWQQLRPSSIVTPIFALIFFSPACDAYALTPQEIYRQAIGQVVPLEATDEKGELFAFHTALLIGKGKAVTQCRALDGATGLRIRQGDKIFPVQAGKKDSVRNLCLLDVPGMGGVPEYHIVKSEMNAGAQVYAVSNALGLGISITEGVISGIRTSRGESFIQFTAAIAPGSEGGALFDIEGRLVGLIDYRPWGGQNVNFAFPARWLTGIEQRADSGASVEVWRVKTLALVHESKWLDLAEHAGAWTKTLPDNAEAWLWLGYAQEQRKDWPAAEKAYRMALQLEPSAIRAGIGLTTALTFLGKTQEALDTARGLLAVNKEDASVWLTIGYVQMALNHPNEAKQAFQFAAQFDPLSRDAYMGLVTLARSRGGWAEALAAQRQVAQISPQEAGVWVELAEFYARANRPERALASAEHAIELAPDKGDGWILKGNALNMLNRKFEAINALKKGLASQPLRLAWGWAWLGNTYYDLRLYPEAIAAYREAVRLDPADSALKGRLGIALKDDFQLDEALGLFEKLKIDNPSDPFPWRQIGFVHGYLAQAQKAIPAYEQSLSLDPKQPKVWAALMEAYHAEGRHEDVKRAYQKLTPLDQAYAESAYRNLILPYGVAP